MAASVERIPGVMCVDVNFATGLMLIEYDTATDPVPQALKIVRSAGHDVVPVTAPGVEPAPRDGHAVERRFDRALVSVASGAALIAVGWLVGILPGAGEWAGVASVSAYLLAVVASGSITWRRALVSLRARMLDMNVLMTIAVVGACAIGEWAEAATVIWLFAVGGYLEGRALERTRRSIRDLVDMAPPKAAVRGESGIETLPAADVPVGAIVVVRPGERIPLDGVVVTGFSAVDESPITGESVPASKGEGDAVFAGSLNTSGLLEVEVTARASDSTIARIIHLVEEAQATRAPIQQMVDRFTRWYTPAVIALAVGIAVVPPLVALATGGVPAVGEWFYRALVMLVVACPCALVISTPVAIVSAISRAGRDGILVKGGAFLEAAARVRAIAFDKTGTLTQGRPAVTDVEVLATDLSAGSVLAIAASLEAGSTHPIALAVVRAAELDGPPDIAQQYEEIPGRGVRGTIDGTAWVVGAAAYVLAHTVEGSLVAADAVSRLEDAGRTALVLAREREAVAVLGVADRPRPEAGGVVSALRAGGIAHIVMLTGDNDRVASGIADAVGVSEVRSRLLPAEKTGEIQELRARHGFVAMVGDGVNDAPALALADVGIAMGAAGSETALETADVALMADSLDALPEFFALGRATVRIIAQNISASVVVKVAALVAAGLGYAPLWLAVLADTGIALVVVLNSLRLLRPRREGRVMSGG